MSGRRPPSGPLGKVHVQKYGLSKHTSEATLPTIPKALGVKKLGSDCVSAKRSSSADTASVR